MANESFINDLKDQIETIETKCGVQDLKETYKELEKEKDSFRNLEQDLKDEVHKIVWEHYGEKTTIENSLTIKVGGVYAYGSSNKVRATSLQPEKLDLPEEKKIAIKRLQQEIDESLEDKIDKTEKVLMDDDRDFDAAKIVIYGYGDGLKLVDLDDNRSCSGDTLNFDQKLRETKVKEIIKQIEYQPELIKVTARALEDVRGARDSRKEVLEEVRKDLK